MKLTVVVDKRGEVTGTIRGHASEHDEAGVILQRDQKGHEIEVPDEFAQIEDAAELHKKVASHVPSA
jgi:hypothetical protein